jgi:hypothetical protein
MYNLQAQAKTQLISCKTALIYTTIMHLPTLLTTIAIMAGTAYAVPETLVHNNCDFPIWYAAVDSTPPINMTIIPPAGYVAQDQWFDGKTGTALKITKSYNGLWANEPVLNFGYTLSNGEIWYDLSTINGFDFWGENITLEGGKKGSEEIVWEGAPGPVHIAHWVGSLDLLLTLCA